MKMIDETLSGTSQNFQYTQSAAKTDINNCHWRSIPYLHPQ